MHKLMGALRLALQHKVRVSLLHSASCNLVIISKRDPERSPEYSDFIYLYGDHRSLLHDPSRGRD